MGNIASFQKLGKNKLGLLLVVLALGLLGAGQTKAQYSSQTMPDYNYGNNVVYNNVSSGNYNSAQNPGWGSWNSGWGALCGVVDLNTPYHQKYCQGYGSSGSYDYGGYPAYQNSYYPQYNNSYPAYGSAYYPNQNYSYYKSYSSSSSYQYSGYYPGQNSYQPPKQTYYPSYSYTRCYYHYGAYICHPFYYHYSTGPSY